MELGSALGSAGVSFSGNGKEQFAPSCSGVQAAGWSLLEY